MRIVGNCEISSGFPYEWGLFDEGCILFASSEEIACQINSNRIFLINLNKKGGQK